MHFFVKREFDNIVVKNIGYFDEFSKKESISVQFCIHRLGFDACHLGIITESTAHPQKGKICLILAEIYGFLASDTVTFYRCEVPDAV